MTEKRNPLNLQDHPHHEGQVNNVPPRSPKHRNKKEKKATNSKENPTEQEPGRQQDQQSGQHEQNPPRQT